ncbi:glycoside hydrolase family 101 beta sandwich domain-containing protein [Actinokineospora soli]|uniref:Glycoside hydrolase family 101 beta sandwich domain-containing protein n=1 Tax=Actinokineospora soli TaxID=1048753 RepID=A0ABW2TMJ1_9PSEU
MQRWAADDREIVLADGVRVTGTKPADRKIHAGDALVADGDRYLLPWNPKDPEKLYHYNARGGQSTWTVPFGGPLHLYKLTDQGRVDLGEVPVVDGEVTLNAEAGVAYVLYPGAAPRRATRSTARAPRCVTPASTTATCARGRCTASPARRRSGATRAASTRPSSPAPGTR